MKLRIGLPSRLPEPRVDAQKEQVEFNKTPVQPAQEEVAATPEVTEVPALTKVEKGVPPLTRVGGGVPPLQQVSRAKKSIDLSSPQPVVEAVAAAEPESGGDRVEAESQTFAKDPENWGDVVVPTEVPKLVKLEKTSTEIPALTSFNTMEVAYLLIGRSVEDEEIVLLQSFSERYVRSKKPDVFQISLLGRVHQHNVEMINERLYDLVERAPVRSTAVIDLSPAQKGRGVEWAAGLRDSGSILQEEVEAYARAQDITGVEALKELKAAGYQREPEFVYTWALVKVKIGRDFGSFKLSDLMPNL